MPQSHSRRMSWIASDDIGDLAYLTRVSRLCTYEISRICGSRSMSHQSCTFHGGRAV